MELVFENGWNGNRGLFDKLISFQRDMDEAAGSPMEPRADVVEDKDASISTSRCRGSRVNPSTSRWRTIS